MPLLKSVLLSVFLALATMLLSGYFFGCEDGHLACHGPPEYCQGKCSTQEKCQELELQCNNMQDRHKQYRLREKHRKASLHKFWRGRPVPNEKVDEITVSGRFEEPVKPSEPAKLADPPGFKNDAYVELGSDPMAGGFLHKDENGHWDVWPRMGGKSFEGFLGYGYNRVKAEGGKVADNIDPKDWNLVKFPVAKTGPASGGGNFWTDGPRSHRGDYTGLVGKTFRFTIGGLAGLDCGCNANFYGVRIGAGCDGSGNNGGLCEEIDFFEGNKWAWHSTLHTLNDGGQTDANGLASGYGGTVPTPPNFPSFDSKEYGPKGSMIDTEKAFNVAASFPKNKQGKLKGMCIELSQEGKPSMEQPLFLHLYEYKGSFYTEPGGGGGTGVENGMQKVEKRLNEGITMLSSKWHAPNGGMRWLDGAASQHGPNNIMDGKCTWDGGCAGYSISQVVVEDLDKASGPPIQHI